MRNAAEQANASRASGATALAGVGLSSADGRHPAGFGPWGGISIETLPGLAPEAAFAWWAGLTDADRDARWLSTLRSSATWTASPPTPATPPTGRWWTGTSRSWKPARQGGGLTPAEEDALSQTREPCERRSR